MNATLHVESSGTGPPLVLLHGWAMHSGLWGLLPSRLAAHFRVHAVDLPGHGHSRAVAPYTLDAVVSAVAEAVVPAHDALTVVGWSLGGTVALRWAQVAPGRVARLVLVAATPCFVARAGWPQAMAADTLARFGDELAVSYRLTLQRFLSLQIGRDAEGRATLAMLRRHLFARGDPAPSVLAAALALLGEIDLRAEIPAITQPALVIAGGRDTLVPPAAGAWLAAALPNARLAPIEGAGHVPFLSHPAHFGEACAAFFDDR
jgi:pimeloyl-[acyl-carrier protein] methyl ester esterase